MLIKLISKIIIIINSCFASILTTKIKSFAKKLAKGGIAAITKIISIKWKDTSLLKVNKE